MSKKLEGNGLFESSRMMLPEHREAYNSYLIHKDPRSRPVIDEQEWQQIGQVLQHSLNNHMRVSLILYDPYDDKQVSGFVTGINTIYKEIKLQNGNYWDRIKFEDILFADIP